jgi:hypothetical protein
MNSNPSLAANATTEAPSWVPADACQLPNEAVLMRLAAFEDLFATAVTGATRPEPSRLRLDLTPDPGIASTVAELAVREADCCGFFTFTLTATQGGLALDVSVPRDRIGVLDGIAAREAGARS